MKSQCESHLKKRDYLVKLIPREKWNLAREIIIANHYSKRSPKNAGYLFMHGLYKRCSEEILGVAAWMIPIAGAAKYFNSGPGTVLTLSKLVILPGLPTNSASFLLGRSIRLIKQEDRFKYLVTYADTRFGHTGAIYKATNWDYVGLVKGHPLWTDKNGAHVSPKGGKGCRTRRRAEMEAMGFIRLPGKKKHKFVMDIRNGN